MVDPKIVDFRDYKPRPGRSVGIAFEKFNEKLRAVKAAKAEKPFSDDVQPDSGMPSDVAP
jgi:hypothetical protein